MQEKTYLSVVFLLLAAWAVWIPAQKYLWRTPDALSGNQRPSKWAEPVSLSGVPNFHRVSTDLYRGEQPTPEGFRNLHAMGIRTIVNLRSFNSDRPEIGGTPVEYEHITMKAWHPEEKEIVRFLQIVSAPEKTPVFVHCQHGADRTGTMCAVYRIAIQGWSKEAAIAELTQGGYGFHSSWSNLVRYLKALDVKALRTAAGMSSNEAAPLINAIQGSETMTRPDEFELQPWIEQYPLSSPPPEYRSGGTVCSPRGLAIIEQIRRQATKKHDLGATVPVDIFVFRRGEPIRRDVTKVGGLPYRPAGLGWPETPEDGPMTFVAQFRFTESKDITGELPGDILLVFARHSGLYTDAPKDPPYFHYEWYRLGLSNLVSREDVPEPAWQFVRCYGYRYRTVDYIDPKADNLIREFLDASSTKYAWPTHDTHSVARIDGMKIGGAPWWVDPDDPDGPLPGKFLCAMGMIGLIANPENRDAEYVWVNHDEPPPPREHQGVKDSLYWFDGCSVFFSMRDDTSIHMRVQLFP